jgi:hypothetical protein
MCEVDLEMFSIEADADSTSPLIWPMDFDIWLFALVTPF